MRIFLTGSTGFIGSQVALELIGSGHQVLGMTRSESGARALAQMGAQAHQGDMEDLQSLQRGAGECDAVIHTAFDHNFANFAENCQKDRRAIIALGSVLEGSNRPLVITSSTAMGSAVPGQKAIEDFFNPEHLNPRVASELAGLELSQRGVNVSVMRLSQIHDTRKQGLVTDLVELARKTGVCAYIEGTFNNWSATHIKDTARLFCLALEKGEPGSRYHATAEEAISFKSIAQTIAQTLGVPVGAVRAEEALAHFGWLTPFVSKDMSASSAKTREWLNWSPESPTLLADLKNMAHA
ncbi:MULTISPECIES: SDR family oxidoreductase [unclassified Pseudomonas]|uniref:SDR family oxidoreductase n=1 Tax=unclassified Pseudomonas TaxID=196821 RepID=UPI001F349F37|nr:MULTISPECIES: SDR family oxidoreductase [unclassified Pseudomonas]MCF5232103.1 NAD-dependent epimerase/dehydratase family protein [Pseudomonas sp. PA-5-4H]MCF5237610.1 NAD-dependent epimerase/dehydratase family protein [Pseudomonas sp. PA-5-4G]MCF5249225.1 NAD-dependent epimerase/dehydratase family protein [Pseudomonas sp. PA-5-4B]MCF5257330.1 NAD-dependent epimerase/dehydratase family protein [Pseudomonas sp. PA-5-4B]MCF5259017.1 NAD-dependent epimerase/dehydratase family protein [Pseudomo